MDETFNASIQIAEIKRGNREALKKIKILDARCCGYQYGIEHLSISTNVKSIY